MFIDSLVTPMVDDSFMTLEGHKGSVNTVAFSPDGAVIASGSDDCTVRLWDAFTGKELHVQKHDPFLSRYVRSVAFSPDSARIAVATEFSIYILDAHTFSILWYYSLPSKDFSGDNRFTSLLFHPGNTTLYVASNYGIRWGDSSSKVTGAIEKDWKSERIGNQSRKRSRADMIQNFDLSPDGKLIVIAQLALLKLFNAQTGLQLKVIQKEDPHPLIDNWVKFSRDGATITSLESGGRFFFWETIPGKEQRRVVLDIGSENPPYPVDLLRHFSSKLVRSISFAISPDGTTAVGGCNNGTLGFWSTQSGERMASLEGHFSKVNAVAFSPDGTIIASGSSDGNVKLWKLDLVRKKNEERRQKEQEEQNGKEREERERKDREESILKAREERKRDIASAQSTESKAAKPSRREKERRQKEQEERKEMVEAVDPEKTWDRLEQKAAKPALRQPKPSTTSPSALHCELVASSQDFPEQFKPLLGGIQELVKFIAGFFKHKFNISLRTPVKLCLDLKAFFENEPTYTALPPKLQVEFLKKVGEGPEFMQYGGFHLAGIGSFINLRGMLARNIQDRNLDVRGLLFDTGCAIAHEAFGHGYLIENTSLGRLQAVARLGIHEIQTHANSVTNIAAAPLSETDAIIAQSMMLTHEGWAVFVEGYFRNHFEVLEGPLVNLFPSVQDRPIFQYQDLYWLDMRLKGGILKKLDTLTQARDQMIEAQMKTGIPPSLMGKLAELSVNERDMLDLLKRVTEHLNTVAEFLADAPFSLEKYNYLSKKAEGLLSITLPDKKMQYEIGFLFFKKLERTYGIENMTKLLQIITKIEGEIIADNLKKYFTSDVRARPDARLALLCILHRDPLDKTDISQFIKENLGLN